jgi:hypothetical protein
VHGAGDAVIGKDSADMQLVKGAIVFGEFASGGDGLALALFFGGDAPWEWKTNR